MPVKPLTSHPTSNFTTPKHATESFPGRLGLQTSQAGKPCGQEAEGTSWATSKARLSEDIQFDGHGDPLKERKADERHNPRGL